MTSNKIKSKIFSCGNEINENDIDFSSAYSHSKNYYKIDIFNLKSIEPLQKIWIRTPKLKVTRSVYLGNSKISLSFPLILGPPDKNIKKFIHSITLIEDHIEQYMKRQIEYQNHNFKRSINYKNNRYGILNSRLPIVYGDNNESELGLHIYNHHQRRILLNKIESNSTVACFLELSDIWIGKEDYGCNWNVLQMKLYPNIDFGYCLFSDDEEDIERNETDCYHCLHCPNNHVTTPHRIENNTTYNSPAPIPTATPLTARPLINIGDLLSAKNSLSSNSTINDESNTSTSTRISFIPSLTDIIDAKSRLKAKNDLDYADTISSDNSEDIIRIIELGNYFKEVVEKHNRVHRILQKKEHKIKKEYIDIKKKFKHAQIR